MVERLVGTEYKDWLRELKQQIKSTQIKASISVNSQLILLYWDLGKQIKEKQDNSKWGSGLVEQLSKDLRVEFPQIAGFSKVNLFYMVRFYLFYEPITSNFQNVQQLVEISHNSKSSIVQQLVEQLQLNENQHDMINKQIVQLLAFIPWGHHIKIMEKVKSLPEALFYLEQIMENNWSRAVLEYHIETNLHTRQGNATTNFKLTLPEPDSDLANALMKSEYNFDFLQMSKKVKENDIEKAFVQHMSQFLTELGKGFAYMGRQYPIKVGSKEYRLDLLFYHTKLKCYIVIELKVREFDPDFTGKLSFYVTIVDELIKDKTDKPTIGILLCKDKDDVVVDFALKGINKPIGVGKMLYTELTDEVKQALPTLKELQEELINFERDGIRS